MNRNIARGALALCLTAWGQAAENDVPSATRADGSRSRILRHALGETRVPNHPTRVITLSYESTENVLALGVQPVGAVTRPEGGFFPTVATKLHAAAEVGTEDEPNLAAIAALQPDVIFGLKLRHAALFPQLSEIAPTVFCETLRGRWRDNLHLWSEALGREEAAAQLMADWGRRVAAVREAFPDARTTRVAVLRFMPSMIRIYHEDSFAMGILLELGFAPSEFNASNYHFEEITEPRLLELASTSALFYFTWDDATGAAHRRARTTVTGKAWNQLPAVRAGRAFSVDDGIWNTGGGILSARMLLDELTLRLKAAAPKGAFR